MNKYNMSRHNIYNILTFITGFVGVITYTNHKYKIENLIEENKRLTILLEKTKYELKALQDTNKFKESYSKLKDNLELIKEEKELTDSDSFENLNQYDDSSSEDSSKSKIDVEFSDDE
tara:strand:- start:4268 stop:4621 length:354 start_codon:yes stop_codon:yes gene_type:complete